MPTLSELKTPLTQDQALALVLAGLESAGYPGTSWQSGSWGLTICEAVALCLVKASEFAATIANAIYNDTAEGDWLDAYSESAYANTRIQATNTTGTVALTCSAAAGPYSITAGGLVVQSGEYTFRSTTGGTLNSGGTLSVNVVAEVGGSASNVGNSTITQVSSPAMAGVTVQNPARPGHSTWMIAPGTDKELDSSLRDRNRAKWGNGAFELSADVVRYYAREASAEVVRIRVDDSQVASAGSVVVYLADADGPVSGDAATAVQAALNARTIGDPFTCSPAPTQTVPVTGVIYLDRGYTSSDVSAAVEAAIESVINSTPIGGYDLSPGPTNVLLKSDIEEALLAIPGIRWSSISDPSGNVTIGTNSVPTVGTLTLTYTAVAS